MAFSRRCPAGFRRGSIKPRLLIELTILVALAAVLIYVATEPKENDASRRVLPDRPAGGRLFIDTVGLFPYRGESMESFLQVIQARHRIEAVVLTLPSVRELGTIDQAATTIMSRWGIGNAFGNRGLLLLYSNAEKEVRVEVSYELEDVFTDGFVGSAQDLQLRPYLRQGDPATGLDAVLEEIEIRADLKSRGAYTAQSVKDLDLKFASGGAGAKRKLQQYAPPGRKGEKGGVFVIAPGPSVIPDSNYLSNRWQKDPRFKPGRTPGEAYELMKAAFLAGGDPRNRNFFALQEGKPYRVIEDGKHAIVYFGNNPEGAYQPFLYAWTDDGWVFDAINQARYVPYGLGNRWMLGIGDHEYQGLFDQVQYPWTMAEDLPWLPKDVYLPENNTSMVARVLELEAVVRDKPDDFEAALELGRLGALIQRRDHLVLPVLDKAKALKPDSPWPFIYSAVTYSTMIDQHRSAIRELREALKRDPSLLLTRKFLGYEEYMAEDHDAAIDDLREVLRVAPRDGYAATYLGYALAARYRAQKDPGDKQAALEALRVAMVDSDLTSMQRPWMLKNSFIRDGFLTETWIGASWYWANYENDVGVLLYDLEPGKAAEKAGLEPGDYILSFDGKPVHKSWELTYFLVLSKPGQRVKMGIVRGALDGPQNLGDGTEVKPKTVGLKPPRRLTIEVTIERRVYVP